ncbi:unnamed protein product [Tilletia controversa]|nr:unnamed protein product [Tilletia controversa]CAD6948061.1 unnamed protein product [Tilletia controversa]CAD6954757.1 unnamed protein product [Tilletia laevis]
MLLLFSFYTGVRTFSLIQTEKTSDYSKVEDVVVLKRSPFEFTIQFNVKNLKCFSGALTRGIKQNWLLHSVTKLIMRGVLVDGDSGERVPDIDTFLRSRTNKFTCVRDAPLFLSGSQGLFELGDKPLSGSAMTRQIHSLCSKAGLPSLGSSKPSRPALNFLILHHRHYTHDTANWSGFAARSVVDALRDIDDAYGLTAPQGSSKAARIEKLKIDRSTKLTDQEEEDLEKDPKLVEADKQFHAAVKRLSRLTAHGTLLQRQDSQFNLR